MAFVFTLIYFITWLMQPWEWIVPIAHVPVLELEILVFLLFSIMGNPKRFSQVIAHPTTRFFLLYILLAVLSVLEEGQGFRIAILEDGYKLMKYFTAYLLIGMGLTDNKKLYTGLLVLLLGGMVVAFFCLRLKYTGVGLGHGIISPVQSLNWRGSVQWIGRFGGSNTTGMLLVTLISMAMALVFAKHSAKSRRYGLLASGLILLAFYHTHSRGGTLGVLAAIGFLIYLHANIRLSRFLPLALAFTIAFLVLKPNEEGRGLGESTTGERVELFYQGLQMVKSEPLLGVGLDLYRENNSIRKEAHNIYLQQVAETGILGAFCYFSMFYAAIKGVVRARLGSAIRSLERTTSLMLLTAFVGFASAAFFLSVATETPFVLLALLTTMSLNQSMEKIMQGKDMIWVGAGLFAAILAVYTAVNLYNMLF